MSQDISIASSVEHGPDISTNFNYYPFQRDFNSLIDKPASSFAPPKTESDEELERYGEDSKKRTYEICMQVDSKLKEEGYEGEAKRKRRLVTLFEANEVAKRLVDMKMKFGGRQRVANGYVVDGEGRQDVVSEWMGSMKI
jgi:hypothetical protein